MLAHAHGYDPLWLTLSGIWLVAMLVSCFAMARAAAIADARTEELPDRERPDLVEGDWTTGPAIRPPGERPIYRGARED